jgi:hypothetical protein
MTADIPQLKQDRRSESAATTGTSPMGDGYSYGEKESATARAVSAKIAERSSAGAVDPLV